MDDGITCDCGRRGWAGSPPVALDGENMPLDVAAGLLGVPEKDLRDLVRITGLQPSGTIRTAAYRRSGRNPRAYDWSKLIRICEVMRKLALEL